MNRKGFIHHPFVLGLIAFFVGALLMFLIAKGFIPLFNVCPAK